MNCNNCTQKYDEKQFKFFNQDIAICYKCYDDWLDNEVTSFIDDCDNLGIFCDDDCKCDNGYIHDYNLDTGNTSELCDCVIFGSKLEEVILGQRCSKCAEEYNCVFHDDDCEYYICDDCFGYAESVEHFNKCAMENWRKK